jgi:PII-like signaling protein
MLKPGPAHKVTIHLNDDTSSDTTFIYEQVFQFLYDNGVAGNHLPVHIQFVDSTETVFRLMPALCELVKDGLIEMQDTHVVKAARLGDSL